MKYEKFEELEKIQVPIHINEANRRYLIFDLIIIFLSLVGLFSSSFWVFMIAFLFIMFSLWLSAEGCENNFFACYYYYTDYKDGGIKHRAKGNKLNQASQDLEMLAFMLVSIGIILEMM